MHSYPPPAYGAPQYGAPAPAYGAPAPAYGAPQYGAPAPGAPAYGAPQQPQYGAPAPGAPPPQPWGAPPPAWGAAPPAANGPPAPGAAASAYGAPAPAQPYGAPSASYPSLTAPAPPAVGVPAPSPASSSYPSIGGSDQSAFGSAAPGQDHQKQQPQPPAPGAYGQPPAPAGYGQPPAPSPYGYGQAPAPAPAPAQAPPAATNPASYTFGQPHTNPQAPPAAAPYGQPYGQPPPAQPVAAAYMPPTTYSPAPGHGTRRRRALLVGCAYPGQPAELKGCLNDVQCIQFCLKNRFGFTDAQIVVLRDDKRHPDFYSSKANIYRGIQWLMMDQQPGDSLFFHFSGHGSQQYDRNGDEEDGYDETICPTDYKHAGQIVDDELNRLMVRPLMTNVTLHAIVDACHSGTALDLPFRAKSDGSGRWYWKGRSRPDKQTYGGTAYQFGACKDSQVAQDTAALSGKHYTGAATFCFIEAIEKYGANQTYGQVLAHMRDTLRAKTHTPGVQMGAATTLIASFLLGPSAAMALSGGGQEPVLSCDKQVDLYATRLSL